MDMQEPLKRRYISARLNGVMFLSRSLEKVSNFTNTYIYI